MEKGLMKVLKDGAYVGVHPETESSQVTDLTATVKAIKVDNATASDTAAKLTTASSIGLTGLIEGAVKFDGSGDVSSAINAATAFDNAGAHNSIYRGKDITDY